MPSKKSIHAVAGLLPTGLAKRPNKRKPTVHVIKPTNKFTGTAIQKENSFKIFLAGSIEMGKADNWQEEITNGILKMKGIECDVIIYNPRRDNWDSSWKQSIDEPNFVDQVEWELDHIQEANLVVFYLQPGTNSPISLAELGIVSHDSFVMKKRVIVLCPEGFHRKGNVDVMVAYFDMEEAKNMKDFLKKIKRDVKEYNPEARAKLEKALKKLSKKL